MHQKSPLRQLYRSKGVAGNTSAMIDVRRRGSLAVVHLNASDSERSSEIQNVARGLAMALWENLETNLEKAVPMMLRSYREANHGAYAQMLTDSGLSGYVEAFMSNIMAHEDLYTNSADEETVRAMLPDPAVNLVTADMVITYLRRHLDPSTWSSVTMVPDRFMPEGTRRFHKLERR